MKLGIKRGTITPKQAIILSVLGLLGFGMLAIVAYLYFGIVTLELLFISATGCFFSAFFPWAAVQLETRNRSVRAHNLFVYSVVGILIIIAITQWGTDHVAFPMWAMIVLAIFAVAAYSVMVYYAVVNFIKWLNGQLKDDRFLQP